MEEKFLNAEEEYLDGEVDINEDQTYNNILLSGAGCLNIGGLPDSGVSNIRIHINTLIVNKNSDPRKSYDFKFTAPRDRKLTIIVDIQDLQNDIKLLLYAPDGADGKPGSNGGDGGDGMSGMGGSGGDGGDGEDGQDGGSSPDIVINYNTSNGSAVFYEYIISRGGSGGKGGRGGKGGLCNGGKTCSPDGKNGRDGRNGRQGGIGSIIIKEVYDE